MFLTDGAGGDDGSAGQLKSEKQQQISFKTSPSYITSAHGDYLVLLGATVVCDAAGVVGVTGGTPLLLLFSFLPGIRTKIQFNVAALAF